jgi:hypothetical protein
MRPIMASMIPAASGALARGLRASSSSAGSPATTKSRRSRPSSRMFCHGPLTRRVSPKRSFSSRMSPCRGRPMRWTDKTVTRYRSRKEASCSERPMSRERGVRRTSTRPASRGSLSLPSRPGSERRVSPSDSASFATASGVPSTCIRSPGWKRVSGTMGRMRAAGSARAPNPPLRCPASPGSRRSTAVTP